MNPRSDFTEQLASLTLQVHQKHISRRAFLANATALGLTLSASDQIFHTFRAGAQDAAQNPINVTVGGTPIAVSEADISNATPGGTLRFGRGEDSINLDPVTNDGNVNIWYFMSVYDYLVRVGADGISLVPSLAESWDISDDGLTYTFHLRPNVLFSDGTPMTSADVLYSWVRAANDPEEHWTFTLTALKRDANGQVEGITAPDDTTVVVELAQPWAPFLSDVAMFNMAVISKAFAEGQEDRLTTECMGTGPFALKEWKKGEFLSLVKNEHYWEENLPLLDGVDVMLVTDDNARILQLQGGELDGMKDVPFSRVPELQLDPNFKVYQFPSTQVLYVIFNTRNAPLDDVHARRALQYATDRQTLIDVVLFGFGIPATSFMPKGTLYWNDTLEGYPYDPVKAQEELAQSKTPNGFPLEIKTRAGNPNDDTLATALKDMWSQIGVELTITPEESTVLDEDYHTFKFEAMSSGWTNDIVDPDELVAYGVSFESSEAYGTGWQDPEAQDLAKKGAAEIDPAKRKEIYFRIQELVNDAAHIVSLYYVPYVDVTTTRVHNLNHPPTGQYDFLKTWIEQ